MKITKLLEQGGRLAIVAEYGEAIPSDVEGEADQFAIVSMGVSADEFAALQSGSCPQSLADRLAPYEQQARTTQTAAPALGLETPQPEPPSEITLETPIVI